MESNEKNKLDSSVPYEVINQEERTIKPVYDVGKAKKRRKGLAWFLGIVSVLGLGYGVKKLYDGSDLKYNNEIKYAYNKVLDTLESKLPYRITSIDAIRFYAPEKEENPAQVCVFATDENDEWIGAIKHKEFMYSLAYEYYETLKSAEGSGDFKAYVEILNQCFASMQYQGTNENYKRTNLEFNEEQTKKFLEMFNLNDYGYNQVGFLPQYIEYTSTSDEDYKHLTYVFKGLSFVKVDDGDGVLPSNMDNALLSEKLNKNKIKVYEVDYTFTFDIPKGLAIDPNEHRRSLLEMFNGEQVCENVQVKPTYVHEIDLTDFKMQNNIFDFDKPEVVK